MYPQDNNTCGSLFKVLLKQADANLTKIISKYKSDKWSKKLSTRDQLELLVSANLAQSKSLSDMTLMVNGTQKFNFSSINKSSLSRINDKRDYQIFENLYLNLIAQLRRRVNYSNLRIIDTTNQIVSDFLFPLWPLDDTRSNVRVGVLFDPNYELPEQIVFGNGKTGDTKLVKEFKIIKGITYLADAGFRDYHWYDQIIDSESFFITRQHKTISKYTPVLQELEVSEDDVISDQIVVLGSIKNKKQMKNETRLIKFYSKEGKVMLLSTNRFDLTSQEIRALYSRRWEIEVFFKFLKQNLKLKRFFGTSLNAVKTQIYCALIAYLLVYFLKPKRAHMSEFMRKVSYALFLDVSQLTFFDSS